MGYRTPYRLDGLDNHHLPVFGGLGHQAKNIDARSACRSAARISASCRNSEASAIDAIRTWRKKDE
ncbi:hypothetical protein ATY79_02240 [Rhizobium sp. R693]|nr:hypothetical protein ATY79_02240 [Rhizobium sp. R693]